MIENRLKYETKGGQVSQAHTYAQRLEYLRMAEECAYVLSHIAGMDGDEYRRDAWLKAGELYKRNQKLVTALAMGPTSGTG